MAKFKKGVSGNPAGRPKGSGWRQQMKKQKQHEEIALNRLKAGLDEIDNWHRERSKIIEHYILGVGEFPFE